ncbi:hypothetical protein ACFLU5_11010 [Bacteroidota bacterium]
MKKNLDNLNISEDTVSFENFTIVELNKNDVFYSLDGSVSITFLGISQDSRCPLDVVCVWEGSVTAKLELHEDGNQIISADLTIPGNNNYFMYKNTYFRLVKVDPYPIRADALINNYTITLEIRPEGSGCQSAIIDTDHYNNPWNDEFMYEEVQIVDEKIFTKIKYGGGCGTIQYEMVSDGIFIESDPPEINLLLSFKDDDACEALVSTTLCFDLSIFQTDSDGGTIQINLMNWDSPLIYSY